MRAPLQFVIRGSLLRMVLALSRFLWAVHPRGIFQGCAPLLWKADMPGRCLMPVRFVYEHYASSTGCLWLIDFFSFGHHTDWSPCLHVHVSGFDGLRLSPRHP